MASRSRARGQPQQFSDYSRAIVETARECLLILNQELQVKAANPAFHQTFRLPPEKTQNRPLFELGNGEWNLPELRSLLYETRTRGVPFEDFEIEREFSGIGRRTVLVSARPVRPGPDSDSLILVTLKDGAERRRTENVQRSMLRVREKLNSTLEPEKLLDDLAREAIELVNAEGGYWGLREPQGMACRKYFRGSQVLPLDYCWPPGHGLAGWLVLHKAPYLTNDAVNDPQAAREFCQRLQVRSAISTPILDSQGEAIAFFEVHNKKDASGFTVSDRESLMAVSRAASTALENALAYQRIRWAEERLKQYAEVVKSMQVGLSIWRLENPHDPRTFRLVVSNPAAERAPGGYAQEFCGKTMAEGFPALFETEIPKILQQVVLSGEGRDLGEIRYRDQNVPEDVFLAKTFPLPDNCAGITLENITRHKRAEEALRRAELPYKELIESVQAVMWRADAQTSRFTFVSKEAETLLGYPLERWTTEPAFWRDRLHPDDRNWAMAFYQKAAAEKRPHQFDYRMIAADGRIVWVRDTVRVSVENGRAKECLGVMIDITEGKQAEEALRLLVEVTAAASEADDIPTTTSRCLEKICQLKGWQVGQAWVVDKAKRALVCVPESLHAELDVAQFRRASLATAMPAGYGLPGQVWRSGTPIWISDVTEDSNFARARLAQQAGLRGAFAFPIRSGRKLFAIFEFFSPEIRTPDSHFLSAVGKLGAHLGIVYERKRAQEELRREKEFTERLISSTMDGVLAFDRACRYTVWNPALERLFGVSKDKTIGRCAFEVFPFLKETGEYKFFFEALNGKSVVARDRPYRVLEKGREGFYEAYYSPIRDATGEAEGAGEVIGGLAIIHDITERKRAEEALQASEQRYRELFENANDVIYIANLQGNILDLNKAAERVMGYPREEALGKNMAEIIDPEHLERSRKMSADGQTTYEADIIAKDGRRVALETSTRLIRSDGKPVAVQGMARDITERKRAEKSLRELSARLIHAQDEERRRIARELHDSTSQSLSALAINLTLLEQEVETLHPKACKALAESRALIGEVSREIRTIAQLLHPPQLDEAGLASAVRGYATSFAERSGVRLDLDVPLALGIRLPQEVETAIFRILQESLSNIHRHSGSPTAAIRLALESSEVVLEVRDQGRGIPPGFLKNSDGAIAGLGVGVAGMRERVRQLGGRLEIDSGGQGTTVKAILPLPDEPLRNE